MTQKKLAEWNLDSGNTCHATIDKAVPSSVSIEFTWTASPSAEDRDQFVCSVLPDALRRATEEFERLSEITSAVRQLEKEGLVEQIGIRNGEPVWCATEKGRQTQLNQTAPPKRCGRVIPFRRTPVRCERNGKGDTP